MQRTLFQENLNTSTNDAYIDEAYNPKTHQQTKKHSYFQLIVTNINDLVKVEFSTQCLGNTTNQNTPHFKNLQ
jgi:phenylacetate-coenzyme A ligase PaaK-like adenylate-forming protein